MTKLGKMLAIVLSLILMFTIIPAVSNNSETKAAETFAITSPTNNKLVAAGYFDIEWTPATESTVKEYNVYIDDEIVETTTDTVCEYYTTEVKMFSVYVEAKYIDGSTQKTEEISFAVTKKGLAVNDNMGKYLDPLETSMGWYYTWGTSPFSYTTYKYAEFVPMKWGGGNEDQDLNAIAQKDYKYLLAYNEPDIDHSGGSNVSVDYAVNNWYKFVGKSDYLGAPAPSQSPSWDGGTWMRSFLDRVDLDTIDFIPLHCYYGTYGGAAGAESFLAEVVDKTWEMYHKPIWVTEFAVSGWGYSNVAARESLEEFMFTVIDGLNEREYVERYSWFSFNTDDENNGASALWTNQTGELTDLGMIYAYYGNPEGYVPTSVTELDSGYKVTTSTRDTAYDDTISIKDVVCNNYIIEEGVSVSASSVDGNRSADKAIDGTLDNDSRWESTHGVDPQTFTIDLGAVKNIKQININWERAAAKDYIIEVSTDGINYSEVASVEGLGAVQKRDDTILFTKLTSAQYIRITGTARTTEYGYSIWELAVYGTDDEKVDETTTAEPTTRPVITRPEIETAPPRETADSTTTSSNGETSVNETTSNINETTQSVEISGEDTNVAKTKVKKATKKKAAKKAKITLKKIKGASKYQIQISNAKKFKKKNILVRKTVKKVKFTIKNKKIKNKKKLYIRARAVKVVDGKKYYGKWSKTKKMKINK